MVNDSNRDQHDHDGEPVQDGQPPREQPARDGMSDVEAVVAAVVEEIESLRQRLDPLEGLDDQLTKLADTVTALASEIAAREQRQQALKPVSWLDLPDGDQLDGEAELWDADAVTVLLGELVRWVQRVYLRYTDAARGFPECWLWHPDVVEELLWLHHAWCCAYQSEDAPAALSWDWHDRYRPGVVRRVSELAGRCSLDQHVHGRIGAAPDVTGVSELARLASWWATSRRDFPPAPSDAVVAEARAAEAARLRAGGR